MGGAKGFYNDEGKAKEGGARQKRGGKAKGVIQKGKGSAHLSTFILQFLCYI